ncbi:hypothetical protein COJ07_06665 [Bacillus cereus]|uniref:hypothetical protein n=1 Tax=Bacillus cereus TaxID=1396 RepID=UPI000BF48ADA|nr:hypothetical protein [Bacillus cereus]PFL23253.1 hypothetical protein COJ07_06665 [Bacillus cereus]
MIYRKTEKDYLDDLSEQLDLLIDYCAQIDQGKLLYTKPMGALLRVLVHQTPKSTSLFTHLQRQHLMKFCSTSNTYPNNDNIIFLMTLITPAQKLPVSSGQIINSDLVFVPNLNRNKNHKSWITFDQWYNSPIFIVNKESDDGLIMLEQKPGSKLVITRKMIITYFSNKDGGTHVDSQVNVDMYNLSKSLSSIAYHDTKSQHSYKPGEKYVPGIPYQNSLHAALRQIAHEIISTIQREFGLKFSYNPSHTNIIGYKIEETFDTCIRFDPKTRRTSITN